MISRAGTGWQTITADLALILFLVTAQAVQDPVTPSPAAPPSHELPTSAEADGLAIYRPGAGQDVASWLGATLTDDRQVATITVRYAPGRRSQSLERAEALLEEVALAGHPARLVFEPAERDQAFIVVGFHGKR